MSQELQRYQENGAQASPYYAQPTQAMDQWVAMVGHVATLASKIADTPFVPDSLRGNPAAVTAAILTGREMGLGPMTALQHIHVIKGKPGKSAEIMRAMVLAAGHEIRDVETTDVRSVIEGRRRGEEQWTRVTFTADQARKAKIDLGGYPEDKLYARATTRLCRRKFADVVGGIQATIEELEDGDDPASIGSSVGEPVAAVTAAGAPAEPKRTTAKRSTAVKKTAKREPQPPKPAEEPAPVAEDQPPLPDDDPPETPAPATTEDDRRRTEDETASATRDQLTKIHAQLGELGIDERADKLTTVGLLVQRPDLASSSDLTKKQAHQAIDVLSHVLESDEPGRELDAILASLEG